MFETYRIVISKPATKETIEWNKTVDRNKCLAPCVASNVSKNAIRKAYRIGFLERGDKYKVDIWKV